MSKSEVWKHFEISRDDAGCKLGICRLCSEKDTRLVLRCSDDSTKGLWKHLEKKHKEAFDKLKKKVPTSAPKVCKQKTIKEAFSSSIPYGPEFLFSRPEFKDVRGRFRVSHFPMLSTRGVGAPAHSCVSNTVYFRLLHRPEEDL